jgi:hypothetical protein
MPTFRLTFLIALALAAASVAAAEVKDVAYPDGYRLWTHVKSASIDPPSPAFPHFGGIHHIYANPAAMTGYRTGKFPDGAVVVFDVLEWKAGSGATVSGARRILDVMARDKRFAATGWGFTEFAGDSHTERAIGPENPAAACAACHAKAPHDGVFSAFVP